MDVPIQTSTGIKVAFLIHDSARYLNLFRSVLYGRNESCSEFHTRGSAVAAHTTKPNMITVAPFPHQGPMQIQTTVPKTAWSRTSLHWYDERHEFACQHFLLAIKRKSAKATTLWTIRALGSVVVVATLSTVLTNRLEMIVPQFACLTAVNSGQHGHSFSNIVGALRGDGNLTPAACQGINGTTTLASQRDIHKQVLPIFRLYSATHCFEGIETSECNDYQCLYEFAEIRKCMFDTYKI